MVRSTDRRSGSSLHSCGIGDRRPMSVGASYSGAMFCEASESVKRRNRTEGAQGALNAPESCADRGASGIVGSARRGPENI